MSILFSVTENNYAKEMMFRCLNDANRHAEEIHGGIDLRELREFELRPEDVIDLSSNILPCQPSPQVVEALAGTRFDSYPDRYGCELRELIVESLQSQSNRLGESLCELAIDNVILGNGCCELIHLVAQSFLGSDSHSLIVSPTFSEYRRACQLQCSPFYEFAAAKPPGFRLNLPSLKDHQRRFRANVVWLCNPNNPTGGYLSRESLLPWIDSAPDCLFVIDESYLDFVSGGETLAIEPRENVIVLRSMTKSFAMAGLRIGYAISAKSRIDLLISRRIPWSVNAMALSAAAAALRDKSHYQRAIDSLRNETTWLVEEFRKLNLSPVPSQTGFFIFSIDNATHLRRALLSRGLLVRDCSSFGLNDHLRVSVRTRRENEILVQYVRQWQEKMAGID